MAKINGNIVWEKFLQMLNSTWGRWGVIVLIFSAGFKTGSMYQEDKMNREFAQMEGEKREAWGLREFEYQKQILQQEADLKEKEIIIKIYETGETK